MSNLLQGLHVLNTRPKKQAKDLSNAIRAAGGIAIELPTLEIQELSGWLNSLPDLTKVQHAIFVSPNAVEHCFRQLKVQGIIWPKNITLIAIGHGSAAALKQFNDSEPVVSEFPDSEHLLAIPSLKQPQRQNILLFKGAGGRTLIEETLLDRAAQLVTLNVYERVYPKINPQFVKSLWHDDLVDIILLTSEQSLHHLFTLFGEEAHDWLRSKPCLVISERLARIASSMGINTIIHSHPAGIMDALFDYVIKD
jgi:uroporphyrinogen-III synthase